MCAKTKSIHEKVWHTMCECIENSENEFISGKKLEQVDSGAGREAEVKLCDEVTAAANRIKCTKNTHSANIEKAREISTT